MLPRRRLFRLLDRRGPVLWITGPPGSGKTALVSSYLESRRLAGLWYQVDEGDGDIASFFYHLGRAATRLARGGRRLLPLLRPENWLSLSTFTRLFFTELSRRLPPPCLIVLDDYHELPDHARLHDVLAEGVRVLPAGGGVIVVSRHEPPPAFARLRADGALKVVGARELRLSLTETEAIARQRPRSVDRPLARRLHEITGGWAAGLVLMLEDIHHLGPAGPTGTPEVVFQYFAAETFRRADQTTRDLLLRTAFLPRMTPAQATALSQRPGAAQVLARLHASNYFTEKLVQPEPVYRYHPLFRQFLLARARDTFSPALLADVRRRAAALLVDASEAPDAVALLREAEDWNGLADLVVRHAPSLLRQGRSQTIEEWIGFLPPSLVESNAWLQYWIGTCRTPFAPGPAREILDRAFTLFEADGDAAGAFSAWCAAVGTILYEWSDFTLLDLWLDRLDGLRRRFPAYPSAEIETRVVSNTFLSLVFRRPQDPHLEAWAERALALSRTADLDRQMITGFTLTTYRLWMGQHARAAVVLEMLRGLGRTPGASPLVLVSWRVAEAYYHWHMASPGECLAAVRAGLDLARETGVHIMDANLLAQGVYGALIAGDLPAARDLLQRMGALVLGSQTMHESQYHFLKGWETLLGRDLARSREHAGLALRQVSGTPFPQAWNQVALAAVLHALGEDGDALRYLAAARETARMLRSTMIEFMVLLVEAELALDGGRDAEGLAALGAAMTLGRAHGYRATPWWRPPVMARLCARALEAGIEVAYVQDLVRTHRLLPDRPALAPAAWPWPVRLRALGGFAVERDGLPEPARGKAQQRPLALCKILIALGGHEVAEAQIADALWPEAAGDTAHQSFATTLHRLRLLLGEERALRLREGRLSLDPRHVWLDVWAFEALLDRAEKQRAMEPAARALLERALDLYRGPFLGADGGAPWAISLRERLRSRFLRATSLLCRGWMATGEMERAARAYERGLAVDDLAEDFYQGLMRCHQLLGRRVEALRVYERCRERLATTLGVSPSARTERLHQALRSR